MWIPDTASNLAANRILLIVTMDNQVYYSAPNNWNFDSYEYRPVDEEVRRENLGTPSPARISSATGKLTFTLPDENARQYQPAAEF